jgi:hypothetical protein
VESRWAICDDPVLSAMVIVVYSAVWLFALNGDIRTLAKWLTLKLRGGRSDRDMVCRTAVAVLPR